MKKNERIIKEIEKEPISERFPIKKEIDLKKEVNSALSLIKDSYSLTYLCRLKENLKEGEILRDDLKHLSESIDNLAQVQIILEKIKEKI